VRVTASTTFRADKPDCPRPYMGKPAILITGLRVPFSYLYLVPYSDAQYQTDAGFLVFLQGALIIYVQYTSYCRTRFSELFGTI
jgi:hypothetical protein